MWLIYNRKNNLFWNDDTGWGCPATAIVHTDEEKQVTRLPMEGEWVTTDSHEAREWKDPDA